MSQTVKPLSETDLAYVAGFLDGDGCISIGRNRARSGNLAFFLLAKLYNTDYLVLKWIRDVLGFGSIYHTPAPLTQRSKRINYALKFSSIESAKLLHLLLPYLHIKQSQAQLGLEFQKQKRRLGLAVQVKYNTAQRRYWGKMRKLNEGRNR